MERTRPDPDALLAAVQEEEGRTKRGTLKIFFGATAGVGKTYAMLEAAQKKRMEEADIVVGLVETHGRPETDRLLAGLEQLPLKAYTYHGIRLSEFDLEGALKRKPAILLVDELAHTNAPGSLHAKRWQDVQDLLEAGINVYTTLNVQHLESVNDIVARITGILVRETVPDSIFDQSDEVELADLTPDDLLQRLAEGKVYFSEQAEHAAQNFFTKGNLIALRELAMRRVADRVEAQMESYRRLHAAQENWPVTDRLLVAISPSPYAQRVVRTAQRMAAAMRAHWIVVYVETPQFVNLQQKDRDRVYQTLRLAEQLGAETVTLTGERVSTALIKYALQRNVNKILVGKPGRPRWRDRLLGSSVDELIRNDAGIDVHVIRGQLEEVSRAVTPMKHRISKWRGYLGAAGVIGLCSLVGWPVSKFFDETSSAMLFILGVVAVALIWGRGASILASLLAVLAFDFFFIPPFLSFTVFDVRATFTFLVILIVGNVIATLTLSIQRQAEIARRHEKRTEAIYRFTQDLTGAQTQEVMIERVTVNIAAVCTGEVVIVLPDEHGQIRVTPESPADKFLKPWRIVIAQWVQDHGKPAGLGSDTLPSSDSFYLPLNGNRGTVGVLGIQPRDPNIFQDAEQMLLLETMTRHAALAFEQQKLLLEATQARLQAETERLRNALLSSLSHDLRSPLAAIIGSATTQLSLTDTLSAESRQDLSQTILEEAEHMNRLVGNLLDMTRLAAGTLTPKREWVPLEDIVGSVLRRIEKRLKNHAVILQLGDPPPLIWADGLLIEQTLVNLLDNAAKYTPPGTTVEIQAVAEPRLIKIIVEDNGPGFSTEEAGRLFDKFYRGQTAQGKSGSGLGLSICRGIAEIHGGSIRAEPRAGSGARFVIELPQDQAPALSAEFTPEAEPTVESPKES